MSAGLSAPVMCPNKNPSSIGCDCELAWIKCCSITSPMSILCPAKCIDHTAAARFMLHREDIAARFVGDSLIISRCRQVNIEKIFWKKEINDSCYELTPVLAAGKLWFKLHGTRDLVESSAQTECSRINVNDMTIRKNGKFIDANERQPQECSKKTSEKPTVLHYRHRPNESISVLTKINASVNDLPKKEFWTTHGTRSARKDKKQPTPSQGYTKPPNKLSEGVEILKWHVMQFLLWIVLPLTISFCLLCGLYQYLKWKCIRKASTPAAADTLMELIAKSVAINHVGIPTAPPTHTSVEDEYPLEGIFTINATGAQKLPHVTIKIAGYEFRALMDTGAALSYMRLSTLQTIGATPTMGKREFLENRRPNAGPPKDTEFVWSECEAAFQKFKDALTSEPILVAPKLGQPFTIEVDSSGNGVGAVLRQAQDAEGKDVLAYASRVVAYASRTYNKHESRYAAIELEALGLVFAVKQFRPYIDGTRTTIITNHAPLKALLRRRDLEGKLAKYQIVLHEYDITIEHRPRKLNQMCDALSRLLPEEPELPTLNTISTITDHIDIIRKLRLTIIR
ncbi:unnamed protein product [Caenorhabditis bovis]|uniref:Reverse transcriptase RNase H-like domain-containing protein n=1 Tax=Caenorhabditis bovis TaxID=2654633 RepID=A0A8S1EQS8_9PELO|nr:unnamed protein product [Caenorhabditis bovis]